MRGQQLSGDLLSNAPQVDLPVVPAGPVGVVVVVGLQSHPLLDLDELGRVAEDVSERPLEDFLLGHGPEAVGIDVSVEEPVAVLQPLELEKGFEVLRNYIYTYIYI